MGGKHPCETIFLYRECVKSLNSPLCLTFDTPSFKSSKMSEEQKEQLFSILDGVSNKISEIFE